jgi:hypothetical protein
LTLVKLAQSTRTLGGASRTSRAPGANCDLQVFTRISTQQIRAQVCPPSPAHKRLDPPYRTLTALFNQHTQGRSDSGGVHVPRDDAQGRSFRTGSAGTMRRRRCACPLRARRSRALRPRRPQNPVRDAELTRSLIAHRRTGRDISSSTICDTQSRVLPSYRRPNNSVGLRQGYERRLDKALNPRVRRL